MFRKVLYVLFVIIVLGIIGSGYFYLKNRNKPIPQLVKAIPVNASFFITGNNFINLISTINKDNLVFDELSLIPELSKFSEKVALIDSISGIHKELLSLILKKKYAISAHLGGNNKIEYLFLFRLEELINEKLALNTLLNLATNVHGHDYEKTKIYKVNIAKNKADYYFSITSGIILISKSEILVESSIRQLNSTPSIDQLNGFQKVAATAGDHVDANLYLNFKYFLKALSLVSNQKNADYLSNFNEFANWSELDVNIKSESILLNGFTYANDSSRLFINTFKGQQASKSELHEVLPANTAVFLMLNISNYPLFITKYQANLVSKSTKNNFQQKQQEIQNINELNFSEEFNSFFDNQIALVYTDLSNLSLAENTYVVVKTKSQSLSKEKLKMLLHNYATIKNISYKTLVGKIKIDNESEFEVYKLPIKNIMGSLFGNIFSSAECNYVSFIDNYMVFGHSHEMLKTFIHANILERTLINEQRYADFYENISSKSSFYFYCNLSRSSKIIKHFLSKKYIKIYNSNSDVFSKFQTFGFQFSESRNMYYNNIYLAYNPSFSGESNTLWESHLDTILFSKPSLVKNHYTHNKEIFVQDHNNQLYLINNKGRVLWKKKLSEKIQGKVHQIDFYKNGKLQILFNTKNQLHLLDRNGNYVERYPITLSGAATNGLSVFDYNNNREYRIFLALENKAVKVYNKEGNIVPGWKFGKTDHLVKKEIKFYRIAQKDYIVFADKMRVYILDRKGNERVKLESQVSLSEKNNFILEMKNAKTNTRLVVTNDEGKINYIYFNGKVETHEIEGIDKNHFFDYQDVDGDGNNDFIFAYNNTLKVLHQNNKEIFRFNFDNIIEDVPVCYTFPYGEKRIGVVIKQDHLIYLFNNKGDILEGFPMIGQTAFSIGKLNPTQDKFNLIVGGEDNFLYNYYLN